MIFAISLFEIIIVLVHFAKSKGYPKLIFLWIRTSAADADAVKTNDMSTVIANCLVTFFINDKSTFINGPRSLPRNLPNCIIYEICVFDKLILAEKLHSKVLWSFATCLSVSNNLCGKLVSSEALLIIYGDIFRVAFPHFLQRILIYEAVNLITLRLHCYIESFYTDVLIGIVDLCNTFRNYIYNLLTVPCEKS